MHETYYCAFCGEPNETFIEPEGGEHQQYVEDCSVCCRPNEITVRWNPVSEAWDVEARLEGRD